jgi:hypothetical protein
MRFRKTLTLLMLAMGLVLALPAWAQQKPLTQDQVQSLVRSGLGDESGAKLIEQRGIDFAPAEDFLQSLKAAGASEAFLKALRAAKPPEPASAKKPLNQVQVFALGFYRPTGMSREPPQAPSGNRRPQGIRARARALTLSTSSVAVEQRYAEKETK